MQGWIDRSAIGLSGLCILHCVAGSVLLATLSSIGGLWSHQVHSIGLLIALPLAIIGLHRGFRLHGRQSVLLTGGAGLALMLAALLLGHGRLWEIMLTAAGVILLGAAHLLNIRWSNAG